MRRKRVLGIFVALLVIVGSVIPLFTNVMAPPPVPKTVQGIVFTNATGVRAFDPVRNGIVATYIKNRTNEGIDNDVMKYAEPPVDSDYFSSAIEDTIAWQEGDPATVVVSVENETTAGGDRAGYVAYVNETLDFVSQPQQFDDTELRKIPVPQFDINGTNFIQFTWTPLPDAWGLIAGYTIYRSTDNETWNLHQDVSVNNPVAGTLFNDTKVSPGSSYYYALKVCFVGYANDNPTNVTNYECIYPGEGSYMMNSTFIDWVIDEIRITDGPDGPNLGEPASEYLNIGESIQATASAYNNTCGFWGVIEVEWSQAPTLGVLSPSINPSTTFTAGFVGGNTTIMAENTIHTLSDTFDIIIREPTVDYIDLTDSPDGTSLDLIEINLDESLTIFASGYNNTGNTFVMLVEVNWTEDEALGGFDVTPSTSAVYTGMSPGLTNITGTGTTLPISDTFLLRIHGVVKEVDYIEITDALDGNMITNIDLGVGEHVTVYASGYNDTTGYYGLVEVDWTFILGGTLGSLDNISGNSTTFTAGLKDGIVEINGTNYYDPTKTDSFTVTILPPTRDYILIRDAPGDTGLDLTDSTNYPNYAAGYSTALYGAAYNTTSGYIGMISETSTWVSDDITIVTPTSPGNQTIINCSDTNYGTITLTLTDGLLVATTNITVLTPITDYIEIHDAPNGLGNVVDTMLSNIQDNYTFYAAGFNNTVGYFADVDVEWTISPPSGVGTVVAGPNKRTTFTAIGVGTCIVTATYSPTVSSSTGLLIVEEIEPVVSYILIRDAPGGAGNVVTTRTYGVYDEDMFYAAAYDSGDNYVMDVEVSWSTSSSSVGAIDTTTGIATNFTAQQVLSDSICTITAEYDTSTSASTGDLKVLAPTVDEIRIVDTSSVGTKEITDLTVIVSFDITGYGASFNDTIGYLYDVMASWDVNNAMGSMASTFPAMGFSSEFHSEISGGIASWTADDGNGHTDTVIFTIMPPAVDYIIIRDAPNGGGFEVTTDFFWGGDTVKLYAAGYNNTADFLYDVDVTWACDDPTVGQVTSPGNSTVFTAQAVTSESTCTVNAEYSSTITDSTGLITIYETLTAPDPPAKPTTLVTGSDSIQLTWIPNIEPNIAGYIVYRRESSNDQWIPVGLVTNHDTTSYTDEDLEPDTKYYYVITAVNDDGFESDPSPEVSATTADEKGSPDVVKPGDDEEVSLSDYWWVFLIIALIIVSLIIGFLLLKRQPPFIQ